MRYLITGLLVSILSTLSAAETPLYVGGYSVDTSKYETKSQYVGIGIKKEVAPSISIGWFYGEETATKDGVLEGFLTVIGQDNNGNDIIDERFKRKKIKTDYLSRGGFYYTHRLIGEISAVAGAEFIQTGHNESAGFSVGLQVTPGRLHFDAVYFKADHGVSGMGFNLGANI